MFRIVERGFNKGDLIENGASDLFNRTENRSFQLLQRAFQGDGAFRLYHVHNGFRLGQIQPAVEKSPLCEFTRFSDLSPVSENCLQDFFHRVHAAVTVYLHRIFTCIGTGRPHHHYQNLVHNFLSVENISVMDRMAFYFFYIFSAVLRTVYSGNHIHGFRPAHTHDTDPGSAHGCGNRRDRCLHNNLSFHNRLPAAVHLRFKTGFHKKNVIHAFT